MSKFDWRWGELWKPLRQLFAQFIVLLIGIIIMYMIFIIFGYHSMKIWRIVFWFGVEFVLISFLGSLVYNPKLDPKLIIKPIEHALYKLDYKYWLILGGILMIVSSIFINSK